MKQTLLCSADLLLRVLSMWHCYVQVPLLACC